MLCPLPPSLPRAWPALGRSRSPATDSRPRRASTFVSPRSSWRQLGRPPSSPKPTASRSSARPPLHLRRQARGRGGRRDRFQLFCQSDARGTRAALPGQRCTSESLLLPLGLFQIDLTRPAVALMSSRGVFSRRRRRFILSSARRQRRSCASPLTNGIPRRSAWVVHSGRFRTLSSSPAPCCP